MRGNSHVRCGAGEKVGDDIKPLPMCYYNMKPYAKTG